MRKLLLVLSLFPLLFSCSKDNDDSGITPGDLGISYVYVGNAELKTTGINENIILNEPIEIRFDGAVNTTSAEANIAILDPDNQEMDIDFSFFSQNKLVKVDHPDFSENSTYKLRISNGLKGENEENFSGTEYSFITLIPPLILEKVFIDGEEVNPASRILNTDRKPLIELHFNSAVGASDIFNASTLRSNSASVSYNINQVDDNTVSCVVLETLEGFAKSEFSISSTIENEIGKPFDGLDLNFYTEADSSLKFPMIPDEDLLTLVQQQTFKYFWDFGHPVSGMARERNTSGNTVTSGGSGFGIMSIIVGIERGFINRQEGIERLETIVGFLERADSLAALDEWRNRKNNPV